MDGFLTPERQRELEELVRTADEKVKTAPPLLRLRLQRARDLTALMLRATGPGGTDDERNELMKLLLIEHAGEEWAERAPRTADERRHKRAGEFARPVTLGWLGHPAVAREVAAASPALRALVEPLGMPDQLTITRVTARFLDSSAFWPDLTEWPNPFDGAPASVLQDAARLGPQFVAALETLATRIAAAGAPLDPADPGVLLVLAQLTLLNVDLTRPAAELVDTLNVWPPGWIDREAATRGHVATQTSRLGRNARFEADLAGVAEFLASRVGPPAIRRPYAGGGRRQSAVPIGRDRRRTALRVVLRTHPDVTPGQLRATWSASPATPGGLLRDRMALQPHDPVPSESTLRADLSELRR